MNKVYYVAGIPFSGSDSLAHFGIKGQKWGVRRYQNEDGTLTEEGIERYRQLASTIEGKNARVQKSEAAMNRYIRQQNNLDNKSIKGRTKMNKLQNKQKTGRKKLELSRLFVKDDDVWAKGLNKKIEKLSRKMQKYEDLSMKNLMNQNKAENQYLKSLSEVKKIASLIRDEFGDANLKDIKLSDIGLPLSYDELMRYAQ